MLACLGASCLIVCLIRWYSDTICLSTPRWRPMVGPRPVEISKEPYLASGRFIVDGAFSDDVFPAWKKLEGLVESRGKYVCLTERVHLSTRIVSSPIWRPEQLMMNTLKYWSLANQAELNYWNFQLNLFTVHVTKHQHRVHRVGRLAWNLTIILLRELLRRLNGLWCNTLQRGRQTQGTYTCPILCFPFATADQVFSSGKRDPISVSLG